MRSSRGIGSCAVATDVGEIKERLQSDLKVAMRSRDRVTTDSVRMAMTAIATEEASGKNARELTEDEEVTVIAREVKRRREAAETFARNGRDDLAAAEREQEDVLQRYLPAPLTPEEIAGLIEQAVREAQAQGHTGMKSMGVVMRMLQPQTKGRVDGKTLSTQVRARLAGE